MRTAARLALTLLTFGAGCGSDDSSGSTPCDPIATVPAATLALQAVLGMGRHADGTIYVLDQTANATPRVFVSEGSVLQRKAITGSGSGSDPTTGPFYVVTVLDPTAPFALKVQGSGANLAMGVVRGTFTDRDFVIGQQGDVLEVVGADAVAGLTVKDLPGTVYVEYLAHLADGRQLVVTRPENGWTYSDFHLFLGTSDRMIERKVKSVVRARDGGTTTIVFVLGGDDATAFFPSPLSTGVDATLTAGGQTLRLASEPAGTAPAGFMFLCL